MTERRRNQGRRISDLLTEEWAHVSIEQVAVYFDVDVRTVRKWILAGALEAFVLPGGRVVRVSRESLVAFREKHRLPASGIISKQGKTSRRGPTSP